MKTSRTKALFGTPTKGRDSIARSRKGRHCSHVDCPTVLSTYNMSETCWLHTPPSTRHPLAQG
jgi:hypothetical protein